MVKQNKPKGAEGAKSIMDMILQAANVSAEWDGGPRNDGKVSNREVVKYLAEGNRKAKETIQRNILLNKEDTEIVAKLFLDEIAKKMRIAGRLDSAGTPVSRSKAAKQGIVSAMRKSAKHVAKIMYNRVKSGTTNDGSKAHAVGEKYAKQRNRKYGVSTSVVFVASTQLANALQKGKVKINFGKANIGRLIKVI